MDNGENVVAINGTAVGRISNVGGNDDVSPFTCSIPSMSLGFVTIFSYRSLGSACVTDDVVVIVAVIAVAASIDIGCGGSVVVNVAATNELFMKIMLISNAIII